MNWELTLGVIGTVLSLALAVWEFCKSRIRFYTSCFWTGNPHDNDVIAVYNGSNRSVVISSFDIFWANSKTDKNRTNIDLGRDGEFSLLSIAPGTAHKIQISDPYKFNINGDKKLYLSLHVMGERKPYVLNIY